MDETLCKGCVCQDCETDCEFLSSLGCDYCCDGDCFKYSCKDRGVG